MRSFFFIWITFCSFVSTAQVEFNLSKHDFGDLEAYSSRYVDVILKNVGPKQEWLLSVKKPLGVVYITSKQIMEQDSSIIVRLAVNPRVKGRFSYEVEIFTSDRGEATIIKLVGNLREVDQSDASAFTSCPNFSDRPGGRNPNKFDLTVVTIDKVTREELSQSKVTMIQNGQPVWANYTDRKGKIKEEATIGLSYFYATHEGYYPGELGAYVNFKRNYVVVELERDPNFDTPVPTPIDTTVLVVVEPDPIPDPTPDPDPIPDPDPVIEIIIEIDEPLVVDLEPEIDTSIIAELPPAFTDLDLDNFDEEFFNPVNVVFVLDVSSSMRQVDKIELMKYALLQLTDMLRPQDRMGIVTYASDSRVLLPSTSGALKDDIIEQVTQLKAYGYTAGGEGIKLGFKEANRAMIDNGTNHVIVITDGAFNRNSDDYKKYIKKYERKGIHMSVVGIKNKSVDEQEMREAAELGGGHYIPIFKLADAQNNLRQEIRMLSFRH
ncbi:MAG: VWA domain-containing protein [Crocinitomicaceae bacterium]|nr:VWA domain-containing protein [Crocinitomicaceae bacterium]